jgi:hypothetical protein
LPESRENLSAMQRAFRDPWLLCTIALQILMVAVAIGFWNSMGFLGLIFSSWWGIVVAFFMLFPVCTLWTAWAFAFVTNKLLWKFIIYIVLCLAASGLFSIAMILSLAAGLR